jgi:N-acyl homoserine lactone hydrolase
MRLIRLAMAACAALFGASLVSASLAAAAGVDKLYILDCGEGHAADQSRWSPGVNVGVPMDISDNCYLIHHTQGGWFLWDTGISDAVATMPDGLKGQGGGPDWKRSKTLAGQLDQLGVKPSDLKGIGISHTHPDHIGNVELFPQTMLYVQKAEYDWPGADGKPRFNPAHPVTELEGDHDLFGDGSVTILSTPGHTPGHQSLLVKLPKTGAIVLSGDAAHFKANFDNRRVPGFNFNKDQTLASMDRIADILAKDHAQLWINHDKAQTDTLKKAPEFYE